MEVRYLALDPAGGEVRGSASAATLRDAAASLRAQGLTPLELAPGELPGRYTRAREQGQNRGGAWRPLRAADQVLFLTQLELLTASGVGIVHGLRGLRERAPHPRLRALAGRLLARVESGRDLSGGFEEARELPALVAQLVRTAEATGNLDVAFRRAAAYIERRAELRFQLISSLVYPLVVVCVSLGVFWFLTTAVVPKFARFLAGRRRTLPWTTQALMDLSSFLQAWGPWILGGVGLVGVSILIAATRPGGRRALEASLLRVPLVGSALRASALAQATQTLAMLLESGLPILQSLKLLSSSLPSPRYSRAFLAAEARVAQGEALSAALAPPALPPLCEQVLATGERSGDLERVLKQLAGYYDRRLQRAIKALAAAVEPTILLVVGGMVGFVYLSFFQAVFQLAAR